MSTIFCAVTAIHSPLILRWNNTARPSLAGSQASRTRDLTAICLFCAVGLIGTLLFVHFFADGLFAVIAEVP